MKTFASLLMALVLSFGINPSAVADDEDDWGDSTGDSDSGDTKDKGDDKGDSKEGGSGSDDPWEAPPEGDASADEPKGDAEIVIPSSYPVSEIDRPLALPPLVLEPLFAFELRHVPNTNITSLLFGAGFGIIDNLEAGLLFPLRLSPKFDAGDMPIYGLYEFGPFLGSKLHIAGKLTINLPIDTHFSMLLEAPTRFKLHEMFAVVGSLGLGFVAPKNNKGMLLNLDFGALVQPLEPLALYLMLGLHFIIADSSWTTVPLYFRGQYTLMGDLDIFLEFGFGDLNHAGADDIRFQVGALYRIGF